LANQNAFVAPALERRRLKLAGASVHANDEMMSRSDTRDNPDVTTIEPPVANPSPNRRRRLTRPEAQALTRRRLLDAAADVFGEKGFRVASLADVADRAGYTIGAVYSNFASKDELFRALMRERLRMAEAALAAAFPDNESISSAPAGSVEDRIEQELDRMAAGEDAVPLRWWRLLYEYRAYAATDPAAWAELSDLDRRCREIIAGHIERFAASVGQVLPMSGMELAELTLALTDGLRAAHADGRSTMSSGEGLRLVVKALMVTAARVDPA
jgi:AcrR family transcriptional regulator